MLGRTPIKTRSTAAARDGRSAAGSTREDIVRNDGSQHCKACTDDDNTRMVQCDKCDDWYHFACVEVSRGVADRDWHCPICQSAAKGAKKKHSSKGSFVICTNKHLFHRDCAEKFIINTKEKSSPIIPKLVLKCPHCSLESIIQEYEIRLQRSPIVEIVTSRYLDTTVM